MEKERGKVDKSGFLKLNEESKMRQSRDQDFVNRSTKRIKSENFWQSFATLINFVACRWRFRCQDCQCFHLFACVSLEVCVDGAVNQRKIYVVIAREVYL